MGGEGKGSWRSGKGERPGGRGSNPMGIPRRGRPSDGDGDGAGVEKLSLLLGKADPIGNGPRGWHGGRGGSSTSPRGQGCSQLVVTTSSHGCRCPGALRLRQELLCPHPALLGLSPDVSNREAEAQVAQPSEKGPQSRPGTETCKFPAKGGRGPGTAAPAGTWRSLREEHLPEHRDGFFPWLWEDREPPGRRAAPSEPGFNNQELVCVLDWNPVRLGPCARCNLSSSSGPKCSPSAEVLAPRVWFGPSFHGKLNNHRRGRNGERAREKKPQQLSTVLPKVERTKTHFGFLSPEPELFPYRSGAAFPTTFFQFSFLLKSSRALANPCGAASCHGRARLCSSCSCCWHPNKHSRPCSRGLGGSGCPASTARDPRARISITYCCADFLALSIF